MNDREVAVIVGAGPGLGAALARRFVGANMMVAVAARGKERLAGVASQIGGGALAIECDATRPKDIETLFSVVSANLGPPSLVVYNAGGFGRASILESDPEEFENAWRVGCFGGFLTGRAAARAMVEGGRGGTILFTGTTASLRGSAQFQSFAAGKFGLRALAQCMARELHPKGIHVAHIVIDGLIASARRVPPAIDDSHLDPDAIAVEYERLHRQSRSAWTQELDLRPWTEKF